MPKPRRRRHLPPRAQAATPPERLAEMPLVFDGRDRIIAPWSHAAMTPTDAQRLACVLDYVRQVRPTEPLWLWPERAAPERLVCDGDVRLWLDRWATGRAVYVAGSARRSG